ncbi:MAG: hypothetical protein HY216_10570 [Candidatus Rokubacteria bacterium]|nr:hypothetical protein [Candidatus Rokubacteria bacterium]
MSGSGAGAASKRFTAYLKKKKLFDEGLGASVDAEISEAIRRFEAVPAPDPLTMFDHVYGDLPPDLKQQRDELDARLRAAGGTPVPERPAPASPPMRGQRMPKQ